jgi:hypothetical protein
MPTYHRISAATIAACREQAAAQVATLEVHTVPSHRLQTFDTRAGILVDAADLDMVGWCHVCRVAHIDPSECIG